VLQVAAAGTRELWLAWIDALIAFEGSLGRSGLLGCYWEVADARDLPVLLLRGSTLSVFGEDPAWLVSGASACAHAWHTAFDALYTSMHCTLRCTVQFDALVSTRAMCTADTDMAS
jgi:hypothetical protein